MLYCACVPSISINMFLLFWIVAFFIFNVFCPYNNLIPVEVSRYLSKNLVKVKVLETTSKWYGITYKEDKEGVVAAIRDLIDKGEY